MQPLRIGLDFDGVIVDHHPRKLRLAGEMGVPLERWQANSNFVKKCFAPEAYRAFQSHIYGEGMKDAPPVAGALEALARLPGEAYVISARRPENETHARAWMRAHGLHDVIPSDRVIFCNEGADKRLHCERLGLALFLDDKLSYLAHLPASMTRVLFDADRIASRLEIPGDLRVAESWAEFSAIAKALVGERA